jgi:hypothetical protein
MRKVSVSFVYGVRNSRTGMEFGQVSKQGSTSASSTEPSGLTDPLALAKRIVDSQMRTLQQDLVPVIISTNRKLMEETSKDKAVKQLMKTTKELVKIGNYQEAIKQYDEIAQKYNSVAAKTNADILRSALDSDAATTAQMAQADSARTGFIEKAVKDTVDAINLKVPEGSIIMLMKSGSSENNLLNDVLERVTTAVVQAGNIKLVDRSNQALIQAEQQFQLSGEVDDNSAISIGHQLGARYAVLCGIVGTASSRRLNVRILDIETGQITDQASFDI